MHASVLLHEVIENVLPALKGAGGSDLPVFVDGTINGGGHTQAVIEAVEGNVSVVGIDLDADLLEMLRPSLPKARNIHLVCDNFRNLDKILADLSIPSVSAIVFDLGWSSHHIESGRGFSFREDEPLKMTYSSDGFAEFTAEHIVNEFDEENIATLLYNYGEERHAKRIARAIAARRQERPFTSAKDLADCIEEAVPYSYRRRSIHPATKTFQALRIAVNDEIGSLQEGLEKGIAVLRPGGRMAIISFHSLEDRIVKRRFREYERQSIAKRITKRPVRPLKEELGANPRSRSARLRVVEKL